MYFNLSQQLSFWISGGLVSAKWQGVNLLLTIGGIAFSSSYDNGTENNNP